MNSVLDDNKTLTLPNGERIELLPSVRVIFEVRDIGHGTPATVSRCGMVWFAENTVLVDDLLQRYMSRLLQLPLNCVTSEIWSVPVTTQQSISDLQLRICAVLEPLLARDGFLSAAVKLSLGFHHIMPVGAMQLCSNVIGLLARFLDDVRVLSQNLSHCILMFPCRQSGHFLWLHLSLQMPFKDCCVWHVGGGCLRPCSNPIAIHFQPLVLNFA